MFIGEFVHDTQQVFPTPGDPRYAESLGQKETSLAECLLHRPLFSDTYLSSFPALQGWDVHLIGAKKLKIFVDDFVYDTQMFILSLLSDMLEVRLTNHQVYSFTQFSNTDIQNNTIIMEENNIYTSDICIMRTVYTEYEDSL